MKLIMKISLPFIIYITVIIKIKCEEKLKQEKSIANYKSSRKIAKTLLKRDDKNDASSLRKIEPVFQKIKFKKIKNSNVKKKILRAGKIIELLKSTRQKKYFQNRIYKYVKKNIKDNENPKLDSFFFSRINKMIKKNRRKKIKRKMNQKKVNQPNNILYDKLIW